MYRFLIVLLALCGVANANPLLSSDNPSTRTIELKLADEDTTLPLVFSSNAIAQTFNPDAVPYLDRQDIIAALKRKYPALETDYAGPMGSDNFKLNCELIYARFSVVTGFKSIDNVLAVNIYEAAGYAKPIPTPTPAVPPIPPIENETNY